MACPKRQNKLVKVKHIDCVNNKVRTLSMKMLLWYHSIQPLYTNEAL